jgi:hypothetical protein
MTIKNRLVDRAVAQAFLPVFFVLGRSEPPGLTRNTGRNACATTFARRDCLRRAELRYSFYYFSVPSKGATPL